jgi:hypothetical protein
MPDGRTFVRVWSGSRFLGRVIDATPYPRDERVATEALAFIPQAYAAGSYDEEGPVFRSLMSALGFFS